MTNREKFQEVFGFTPPKESCVKPFDVPCEHKYTKEECRDCVFDDFWDWEYREDGEMK
jgi:hypothetical protein